MKIVPPKSQEEVLKALICAWIQCVLNAHGTMYNKRELLRDQEKVLSQITHQGVCFMTKQLPKVGKALDRALAGDQLNIIPLRLGRRRGTELPKLFGEFFRRIFSPNGQLLDEPCVISIRYIREILYMFYKYKLPNKPAQERVVIEKFVETDRLLPEQDLECTDTTPCLSLFCGRCNAPQSKVLQRARDLLSRLFLHFDPLDIYPRHGPGSVSTRERLEGKYRWTGVSKRITDLYPFDAYYCASLGHVSDSYESWASLHEEPRPARVILVPKDSRGPRLISSEPLENQWIQQGLGGAIVQHIENHPLTKWNVFFTNQKPNQFGAQLGSKTGRYATLDLSEASDRVSLYWVRALFPVGLLPYLEACRSAETELPDGRTIKLSKFAPMGSALCFPILALTIWAVLTAAAPDADTKDGILVYGDDVIVPTAYAENAIEALESVGLEVNHDKSFIKGLFRESCGCDAFQGFVVTPSRIKTVWSSSPSADVYASYIAYANNYWDRGMYVLYNLIVDWLYAVYGRLPEDGTHDVKPSLRSLPNNLSVMRRRTSHRYQKQQYFVPTLVTTKIRALATGWMMLLRYFAEYSNQTGRPTWIQDGGEGQYVPSSPTYVDSYTPRGRTKVHRRWR